MYLQSRNLFNAITHVDHKIFLMNGTGNAVALKSTKNFGMPHTVPIS